MKRTILIRLGGLAAMVGGMLLVAAPLGARYFPQAMQGFAMEAFLVVALLLVPVGMVGFHAIQSRNYGRIGRAGFWISVAGPLAVALGAVSYLWWGSVFGSSVLWLAFPVGPLVLLVGFVLYEVATLRANVLPPWCGAVFIVAVPAALGASTLRAFASVFIVFGLAWLALGYALWSHRSSHVVERGSRVR